MPKIIWKAFAEHLLAEYNELGLYAEEQTPAQYKHYRANSMNS